MIPEFPFYCEEWPSQEIKSFPGLLRQAQNKLLLSFERDINKLAVIVFSIYGWFLF